MNEAMLRLYAKQLAIDITAGASGGWIQAKCPLAPWTHQKQTDTNASLGITTNPDKPSYVHCFSCGYKDSFIELARLLGRKRNIDYNTIVNNIIENNAAKKHYIKPPSSLDTVATIKTIVPVMPNPEREFDYPTALGHYYLRERGIDWLTTYNLRLRYDPITDRILFPVYDYTYKFAGFTGRLTHNNYTKKNPKVRDYLGLQKRLYFLGEHNISYIHHNNLPIIIVEGLLDYARMHSFGYRNVFAILGSEVTKEKLRKLQEFERPIIWLVDNDDAGIKIIKGNVNPDTGIRDYKNSASYMLLKCVPQYFMEYPNYFSDPGDAANTSQSIANILSNKKIITNSFYLLDKKSQ